MVSNVIKVNTQGCRPQIRDLCLNGTGVCIREGAPEQVTPENPQLWLLYLRADP